MRGFDVFEPQGKLSPVVIEVPHAGTWLEPQAARWMEVPARMLAHDADLYVDELFANCTQVGATLVRATLSRHVMDVNTAPRDDFSQPEPANFVPRQIMHRAANGERLHMKEAPWPERARRWNTYGAPYHATIETLLAERKARFGRAVLVSAHSYPPPRGGAAIADVVVGWLAGRSSSDDVAVCVERVADSYDWSVARDQPFAGGYALQRHGRPTAGIHAIQVEIRRGLYLDNISLTKSTGYDRVAAFGTAMVDALTQLR